MNFFKEVPWINNNFDEITEVPILQNAMKGI
jgi:hypothetical protein